MQVGGIGPTLVRIVGTVTPDLLSELLVPGRVVEADVISVYQGRAILTFGRGTRLEVALQASLQEGQRIRLQVQGQADTQAPSGGAQAATVLKLIHNEPRGQDSVRPGETMTAMAQREPGTGNVMWLPIQLAGGEQAWVQLQVQADAQRRSKSGTPTHRVCLWWQTTALGTVQVTLDAAKGGLTALFTVLMADSRLGLEQSIPDLKRRLAQVGFPDARIGCRHPLPGETVEPVRVDGASRIDHKI